MKKLIQKLVIVSAIMLGVLSCSDDEYGAPVITIDTSSVNNIYSESFCLKGKVISEKGSVIENVSLMALYKASSYVDPWSDVSKVENKTELLADKNGVEIRMVKNNEYEFHLTKENAALFPHINQIYGIRINASVKDGKRSSKTWDIKAQ